MNKLFVANKPSGISSNHFLSSLKRKYKNKKAGFSGTLDPFASGCLIVAFGNYTRLFQYLKKTPKTYIATMWLGANSLSLDNQNITEIKKILPFHHNSLEIARKNLLGKISYTPPNFCAKKINGIRAYDLARKNKEFELKKSEMMIYGSQIINYMHPFVTFKVTVSEGAYVRSYAQLFAKKIGTTTTLTGLERINEGDFFFQDEKELNPLEYLDLKENFYLLEESDVFLGKKLDLNNFKMKDNGKYVIVFETFFTIIEIKEEKVSYLINRIER